MDLVLITLVDKGFNGMFSNPHCRYTWLTAGSSFNHIGGHEFQWLFSGPLYIGQQVEMSQQVDLVLIRLMDMSFNRMFSYPHCMYIGPF